MRIIRWAVFVSGEGTNLQNFLDLEKTSLRHQKIVAVHADRPCKALERAARSEKACLVCSPKEPDYISKLQLFLEEHAVDRIFLLGFMRILNEDFLRRWPERVVNLHPSLLPAYKGLNAIQRAYEAGESQMGVTLHLVTPELDSGPILRQKSLKRDFSESLTEMEHRIHRLEYEIVQEYLFDLESKNQASLGY